MPLNASAYSSTSSSPAFTWARFFTWSPTVSVSQRRHLIANSMTQRKSDADADATAPAGSEVRLQKAVMRFLITSLGFNAACRHTKTSAIVAALRKRVDHGPETFR